jgi:hypothetical protein
MRLSVSAALKNERIGLRDEIVVRTVADEHGRIIRSAFKAAQRPRSGTTRSPRSCAYAAGTVTTMDFRRSMTGAMIAYAREPGIGCVLLIVGFPPDSSQVR